MQIINIFYLLIFVDTFRLDYRHGEYYALDMKTKKYLKNLFIFTVLSCLILEACEIPVFRYALERWQADKYKLVISKPESGQLSEQDKELVKKLEKMLPINGGNVNLDIEIKEGEAGVTTAELFYPSSVKSRSSLWRGFLNKENVDLLVNSPLRKEIVNKLLSGESVVWLLVDASPETEKSLKELSQEIAAGFQLSEEIIQMDDLNKINSITTKKELDNVIRSTVPLKISFSTISISRDDAKEEIFLNMLLNQLPHLRYSKEPVAIPIFGRGRFLEPAPLSKIDRETVKKLATYLCSGCSCTVKSENPGVDLLLDVPWAEYISESVIKIKEIPAVSSVAGDLDETPAEESENAEIKQGNSLVYILVILGGGIMSLIIFSRLK